MAFVKGTLAITFIVINTAFCCVPIYLLAIPRFLLPHEGARVFLASLMTRAIDLWVGGNRVMIRFLRITRIEVDWNTQGTVDRNQWHLVISNHQGWSDILVLQDIFLNRIPPLKFFVKRELLWVPLIGFAMWLLDFPYVYRFSRAALEARPELRSKDAEAVARACENFKSRPTTVLNFAEGTRITPAKHAAQQSQFKNLLTPKTGGINAVLASLGDRLHRVLDVTIAYPDGIPTFMDFLCGRVDRVKVVVVERERPSFDATDGVAQTREWIDDVWRRKDERIEEMMGRS